MKKSHEIDLIYIAGYGRSGSTLADILIGNFSGHFSGGEISFFALNGIINNEFCSCGSKVHDCPFWKNVMIQWQSSMKLSITNYHDIYFKYLRNKRMFSFFYRIYFPDNQFKNFLADTQLLYAILSKECGGKVIIDSSKSPYRLFLLKKLGLKIRVIHLVRSLRGVLYATSKSIPKNLEQGVESELMPRNKWRVMLTWLIANFWISFLSRGLETYRISYEKLIKEPTYALQGFLVFHERDYQRFKAGGPFFPEHLVAGGRVRMQKEIFIDANRHERELWKGNGLLEWMVGFIERVFR